MQSPPEHVSEQAVWAGSHLLEHLPPGQSTLHAPALAPPGLVSMQSVLQPPPLQSRLQLAILMHFSSQLPPSQVASQLPIVQKNLQWPPGQVQLALTPAAVFVPSFATPAPRIGAPIGKPSSQESASGTPSELWGRSTELHASPPLLLLLVLLLSPPPLLKLVAGPAPLLDEGVPSGVFELVLSTHAVTAADKNRTEAVTHFDMEWMISRIVRGN